jgi:hypothetical protein
MLIWANKKGVMTFCQHSLVYGEKDGDPRIKTPMKKLSMFHNNAWLALRLRLSLLDV